MYNFRMIPSSCAAEKASIRPSMVTGSLCAGSWIDEICFVCNESLEHLRTPVYRQGSHDSQISDTGEVHVKDEGVRNYLFQLQFGTSLGSELRVRGYAGESGVLSLHLFL